jgi:hypothetical protein
MDSDNEIAKAKWLLGGIFLFLISGCFTYRELNFWLRGTDGQATVVQVFESRGRRGSTSMTIEYEFSDTENNRRKDQQSVSPDSSLPGVGSKIPIRYTPGKEGSSRLLGGVNWLFIGIFVVSIVLMGIGIFALIREANDDGPKRKKKY